MSEISEDGLEFIKKQRARRELGVAPPNREFGFEGKIFIPGVTDACVVCGTVVGVPEDWDKPENCWVAICNSCNDASGNPESYK